MPSDAPGYLIYIPSAHQVCVSVDVYFDEHFRSTIAHMPGPFARSFPLAVVHDQPAEDAVYHYTDDALAFQDTRPGPGPEPFHQLFARPLAEPLPTPHDDLDPLSEPDPDIVKEEDHTAHTDADSHSSATATERPAPSEPRAPTPTVIWLLHEEGYDPHLPHPRHMDVVLTLPASGTPNASATAALHTPLTMPSVAYTHTLTTSTRA
jgi:hypothetical protein